jgi:hypothetical protein
MRSNVSEASRNMDLNVLVRVPDAVGGLLGDSSGDLTGDSSLIEGCVGVEHPSGGVREGVRYAAMLS